MTALSKAPVIFDTDPGIDDAMALLFLNACQQLELKGITTVFGNASIEQCTNNALYLCERFNIDVPVYAGAKVTVTGKRQEEYPAFVHGDDGLGNINAAPLIRQQETRCASDFLVESAKRYAGELIIIAVGRMTNLALAIQADPEFSKRIKEVILMGGAIDVPGNVSKWAEANSFGDPEATDILFKSGIPVTQVGLDVTMKTIMSGAYIDDLCRRSGDAGKLLSEITPYYLNFFHSREGIHGFACHDSSAVAFAEDPEIYGTKKGTLSVVLQGEQRGRTLFEEGGGNHRLCTAVNAERLLKDYDQYLVRQYG